jgi:tRNA dimethylallyltransferase
MKKIIVIGGATASGKTSLAIDLALKLDTEILSADSRQCYREMTIGTAAPTPIELNKVRHHFIHSHSIHEHFTAGDYEKFALNTIENLFKKKDTIVVVGGTGLYIKALCEGMDDMPKIVPEIEKEIKIDFKNNGIIWLQNEIKKYDTQFYEEGEINNPMRLLRALGFIKSNGKSILTFRTQQKKIRPFDIEHYTIETNRNLLYERINKRVDHMMEQGLLNEAKKLYDNRHLKNLQTVGYNELFDYLEGKMDLHSSIEKIKQHTRNYAKRQMTWFKNQTDCSWIQSINDIDCS